MGQPKALLPYAGSTFLEHIVEVVRAGGASPVTIILGHEPDRILRNVQLGDAHVLHNQNYKAGQLSSLQVGLRALETTDVAGTLMCLVDHPVVSVELVRALIRAFRETGKPIVIPVHGERRGHPILLGRTLFQELLGAPFELGARTVIRRHVADTFLLITDEPGILTDVDTPEEYRGLRGVD